MTDPREPTPEAMPKWVLYLLCGPAAALGLRSGLSMKDLLEVMQIAIYRAARDEGWSQAEAAEHLDVSVRTIAELSRMTKDTFSAAEDVHELPRRIELLLWAQPLTLPRIRQALREVEAERVDAAVQQLLDERCIKGSGPSHRRRYSVTRGLSEKPRNTTLVRLDGLKRFMGGVRRLVGSRFFGEDGGQAGALNFDLRLLEAEWPKFEGYTHLWRDLMQVLDQAAIRAKQGPSDDSDDAPAIERVRVSMFWMSEPDDEDG